jgi:hypothetical protein
LDDVPNQTTDFGVETWNQKKEEEKKKIIISIKMVSQSVSSHIHIELWIQEIINV